jgi:hypothetical protein
VPEWFDQSNFGKEIDEAGEESDWIVLREDFVTMFRNLVAIKPF